MANIQIDAHQRLNWTLEDKNAKVALEPTITCRKNMDGCNLLLRDHSGKTTETWLDLDEMKSLSQWLVKTLDIA